MSFLPKCEPTRAHRLILNPIPLHALHDQAHRLMALLAVLCMVGWGQAQTPVAAASPVLKLHIVGGLSGLNQYTQQEEPFWSHELARLSAGKYSADIVPFDRAGVSGPDMLRLMQLGVMPFGTMLISALGQSYPPYAAIDLAGLNPDLASLKKSVAAFLPFLEHELRVRHNIQMLALYTYPAQVIFCQQPFAKLTDLAGRHIRVSSVTQSDFVTALQAIPVRTGFGQIMANMQSGNTNCAITGTQSGNMLGLSRITSHIHTLPITWGLAVFAANKNAWDALPPDLKALLGRELPRLEASIWRASELETAQGMACNTGSAACSGGNKGKMVQVVHSASDDQLRQQVLRSTVLPGWLARCGAACASVWNQTLAASLNPPLQVKP